MEDGGLLAGVLSTLMAGDDGNDEASPRATGCVLFFCLSGIHVRLQREEPRATVVKGKKPTKKKKGQTAQCSRNFCCPFTEMQFHFFFLSFFKVFGLPAPKLRWLDFVA